MKEVQKKGNKIFDKVVRDYAREHFILVPNEPEHQIIFEFFENCCKDINLLTKIDQHGSLDRNILGTSLLRTCRTGIAQVDHTDFSLCKKETFDGKKIIEPISVIIQLEGSSELFINVSANDHCKQYLAECKFGKNDGISLSDIYQHYKPPTPEIRDIVKLTAGMAYIGCAKNAHGGHAAFNLTNRRLHGNIPVKDLLDYNYDDVYIVPSLYGVTPDLFIGEPILEKYNDEPKTPIRKNKSSK